MRFRDFFAAAFAMLLCPTFAYAQGGAGQALAYTWSGFYGGINVGYGWQQTDWDFGSGDSTSQNAHSGVLGLQAGYGAQVADNLYAGIEASVDASALDGTSSCLGGTQCETRLNAIADISGRLGVVYGETLLYGKAGLAYENSNYYISGISNDDEAFGYLLGAGVEYALMYNLTTRLEYNYMGFGSKNYTVDSVNIDVKEPINVVKLGFNLKFD